MEFKTDTSSNRIEAREGELIGASYCVHTYNNMAVVTGEKVRYYDREPEFKYSWDTRAGIEEFADMAASSNVVEVDAMDLFDELNEEKEEDVQLDSVSDEMDQGSYNAGVIESKNPRFNVRVNEGVRWDEEHETEGLTAVMVTTMEPTSEVPAAFHYQDDDISEKEFNRRLAEISGEIGNHRFHAGNIPK